jgi:site-specific DNA-methyltransferase (adenine-specific)
MVKMRSDVKMVEIGKLKPYERNAKKHPQEQIDRLALHIEGVGWDQPIVCDEDFVILKGHGRRLASIKLGLNEVPVIIADGLSEAQKKAVRLADNKLAESPWDDDLLKFELDDLALAGWDLGELGFEDVDTGEGGGGTEGNTDPDDVPEEAPAVAKRGQIWQLGRHRVMCGDSTSEADVARLMGGVKAMLLQTDPPYGIAYVSNAKSKNQSNNHRDIENDDLDGERLQKFLESTIKAAIPHLKENCAFYFWHPMLTQGTFFAAAAAAADILIHRQIIWCKPSLVFGRGDYHWQHELCFYGWVRGNRPPFYGERNQTTLWAIGRETSKEHPTAKPIALWKAPFENHTKKDDVAYEPFCGSGSQIIAAESYGRTCYGMEIDSKYVDVIIKRWEDFTGQKAELVEDAA